MPHMSIFPLEQFEKDLRMARHDRELYEKLQAPKTVVVRFGFMGLIGEYPYSGTVTPGCGSKLVVRTHRGTEIGEMLTSTCANSGCSKSISRQEMLDYIDRSGGRDYPFFNEGRAIRVATIEDLNQQARLEAGKTVLLKAARKRVLESSLPMQLIEAEPILGGERLTFYFTSEDRIDFRDLARTLAEDHRARIELRHVGARDEARLTADYERCGQHCCCKQFLKVLRPVSMRSAKVQKATLDPLKISGRCGRLMCCLRYEDETYETLRKRLPNRKARVGTLEGPGIVIDLQILTQLVLVELESDGRRVAIPLEELCDPDAPLTRAEPKPDPLRGMSGPDVARRVKDPGDADASAGADTQPKKRRRRAKRKTATSAARQEAYKERSQREGRHPDPEEPSQTPEKPAEQTTSGHGDGKTDGTGVPPVGAPAKKKKRRRGRRGRGRSSGGGNENASGAESPDPPPQ